jgi:uncharacterized CHY-type Zn-finger protein
MWTQFYFIFFNIFIFRILTVHIHFPLTELWCKFPYLAEQFLAKKKIVWQRNKEEIINSCYTQSVKTQYFSPKIEWTPLWNLQLWRPNKTTMSRYTRYELRPISQNGKYDLYFINQPRLNCPHHTLDIVKWILIDLWIISCLVFWDNCDGEFFNHDFFPSVSLQAWHKTCFKCHECGMALNMKTYKGFNKNPYCEA